MMLWRGSWILYLLILNINIGRDSWIWDMSNNGLHISYFAPQNITDIHPRNQTATHPRLSSHQNQIQQQGADELDKEMAAKSGGKYKLNTFFVGKHYKGKHKLRDSAVFYPESASSKKNSRPSMANRHSPSYHAKVMNGLTRQKKLSTAFFLVEGRLSAASHGPIIPILIPHQPNLPWATCASFKTAHQAHDVHAYITLCSPTPMYNRSTSAHGTIVLQFNSQRISTR